MMIGDFRKRFWISLIVTIPILVLSPMIQELLGYSLEFSYSEYILFALSAFVYFYGGWPFLKGLVDELKERQPGMMTLIAVAITVAFGYSSATTFGLEGKKFFWELVTLIDIMLLGHWIEMRSVVGASRSLQKLVEMMPAEAHLLDNGNTKEFQQSGEFVAMTGDGINDAPALATADVGIAVGSGTDIAAETADIILVNSNPKDIASLVVFGKETHKKMIQNFVWATGYNIVAIPLAAGVLYSAGILINPALGALLMSLSTVIVAINAQLLKRKLIVNH
jgi:cation transport ATPase